MAEIESESESASATELPVVVLGEAGAAVTPRHRLLYGRLPQNWVLYPIYLLVTIAGSIATNFALNSDEWHVIPTALGWSMLFIWYWFYGVAYRYRRRLLKYSSVTVIIGMTWALGFFCEDRALRQIVAVNGQLIERSSVIALEWASVITWLGVLLLMAHIIFLGRGYREKRDKH